MLCAIPSDTIATFLIAIISYFDAITLAWMWLVGTVYNWATYRQSLALELKVSARKRYWLKRSPAIASQLTDHLWTIEEILKWKRPTSGALSKQLLRGEA